MKEITYEELEKIVQKQPTAFLCGNGFSINFDSDFANIYDRLYETHKLLIRNGKFEVKANNSFQKIFKDNYKSVCKYVYTYRQITRNVFRARYRKRPVFTSQPEKYFL